MTTLASARPKQSAAAQARAAALIEDVQWMAAHGESLTGAATRLHMTRDTLDTYLRRWGRPDLTTTMKARDPQEPR